MDELSRHLAEKFAAGTYSIQVRPGFNVLPSGAAADASGLRQISGDYIEVTTPTGLSEADISLVTQHE
ncbi:hypothetical protein O9K51_08497 [Purpureocillium lavendulum]|uniref:Uncharacterized protein n=1 Tax=Purpureocillium lavendulum TaxID=1247861 RepID=A0AB34FIP9_9HYPO|nr:hypothetical protein O9K51_08497 [Purpureocillium lavendulum]